MRPRRCDRRDGEQHEHHAQGMSRRACPPAPEHESKQCEACSTAAANQRALEKVTMGFVVLVRIDHQRAVEKVDLVARRDGEDEAVLARL
jgi:hypothetical protein